MMIKKKSTKTAITKEDELKQTFQKTIRQAPFLSFQTESSEASADCHQLFSWTT
jgi:hypothetical protein